MIQKLGERWDSRMAAALNRFLRRSDGWGSDRIRAAALLLNHRSPAVFIANTNGVIRFVHVNPDYKVRLAPAKILEAVRATMN